MPDLPIVERELEQVRTAFAASARELAAVRTFLVHAAGAEVAAADVSETIERATTAAADEVATLLNTSEDCVRAVSRHLSHTGGGTDEG